MIRDMRTARIGALAMAVAFGYGAQFGPAQAAETETAVFAGGCFWCVESDFEQVKGVKEVVSGFAGDGVANPTYHQVSAGGTDYRESAKITYDPDQVTYRQLVHLFFRSIDPTDDGGQFCDRGHSYTTAVFVDDASERKAAKTEKADAADELGQEIVTPVVDDWSFYPAGEYHQDYYKSDDIILFTRYGPTQKKTAYKRYRQGCGRDARVQELWGDDAPFVGGHSS